MHDGDARNRQTKGERLPDDVLKSVTKCLLRVNPFADKLQKMGQKSENVELHLEYEPVSGDVAAVFRNRSVLQAEKDKPRCAVIRFNDQNEAPLLLHIESLSA